MADNSSNQLKQEILEEVGRKQKTSAAWIILILGALGAGGFFMAKNSLESYVQERIAAEATNFKGEKGDAGPQGSAGENGDAGAQARLDAPCCRFTARVFDISGRGRGQRRRRGSRRHLIGFAAAEAERSLGRFSWIF